MKIVIDTEACRKNGKDVDLVLYLASLMSGNKITPNTFEKARQGNFISFNSPYIRNNYFPDYVEVSEGGKFVVNTIMADSQVLKDDNSEARFINLANRLRELFPEGKKPGYAYTWRDSTSCIVDRLKKFVVKYGDYPDDAIVEATQRYINSFGGNYKYMQLLKYFIWKNKVTGEEVVRGRIVGEVERQSQLASYLDNKEDIQHSSDWDAELK